MDIVNDVRTLEELERNAAGIIREVQDRRRPMMITSQGKPGVVIIPAQLMATRFKALEATCELAAP